MIEKELLPSYRTGFRSGHSCLDAASVFRDITIHHGQQLRRHVVICLLDIKKAFDSVWIKGLLSKFAKFKIKRCLRRLIESFLYDREAYISLGTENSTCFTVTRGVHQGTVLGPHLYILFVADQPQANRGWFILQYADDTANIAVAKSLNKALRIMQSQIKKLEKFYKTWGIEVNGAKTEVIVFRPKPQKHTTNNCGIAVGRQWVSEKESVKYRGIQFDRSLKPIKSLNSRLIHVLARGGAINREQVKRHESE